MKAVLNHFTPSSRRKIGLVVLGCATLVAAGYSFDVLTLAARVGSLHSAIVLTLIFAAMLPGRWLPLSLPLALIGLYGLGRANEAKIAAVALPITFLDVRMAVGDPGVLWNALGLSTASLVGAGLAVATSLCALAVYAARTQRSRPPNPTPGRVTRFAVGALLALALVVTTAERSLLAYAGFVNQHLQTLYPGLWLDLWLPQSQVTLARQLGFMEYLAFTYLAGDRAADTADSPAGGPSLPPQDIRHAARRFVRPMPAGSPLPNIVILHAESTFDPNLVFRLSREVKSPLWSTGPSTVHVGPLRVNVVGGGSWVTEFEVLTGVDSRTFGYHGFYTHQYVAPRVRHSLPRYLAARGYQTAAYYPVEGSFYDAERAFRHYGFQKFVGGGGLGLDDDWTALVDRTIVARVIAHGAFRASAPFFVFISTSENHGPHPCRNFAAASDLPIRFAEPASFEQHCGLNEYLLRSRSTADGLEQVLRELQRIEAATGRPFVLLVYGDHQPWSFTDGLYSVAGGTAVDPAMTSYAVHRRSADGNLTFYHLLASGEATRIEPFVETLPASFLPSLLSSVVATSDGDLYLPMNFAGVARCGPDVRSPRCPVAAELAGAWRSILEAPPTVAPRQPAP